MAQYPKLKLTYFDAAGRAESIRLAFHIGNVPFEDERLTGEQFAARKSTFPFGQAPVLEVNGEVLAQSLALLRYAGRLAGLYPLNDPVAALKVDEILAALDELMEKILPSFREQDPEKKKTMREELANVTIPRYMKLFEARLAAMKSSPVFQTSSVFIHEIAIFNFVGMLKNGVLDHVPKTVADAFPEALAVQVKVASHPRVKEWYAAQHGTPKLKLTYFNGPGRAEPIRLAFHYAGIKFEDERIDYAEVEKRRATLPYGQVPVLDINGEVLSQSLPILQYAGTISGLYPANDPAAALRIDEVFCIIDEMYNRISPTYRIADQEKKLEARRVLAENDIPKALKWVDSRVAHWGGPHATGKDLTVADLAIYAVIVGLQSGALDGVPVTIADDHKNLMEVFKAVQALPQLQAYLKRG